MWCYGDETNAIWDNYNNSHYDVTDSFQYGVRVNNSSSVVVPVCLTKGGTDVTTTPLYDTTFTNQPNLGGNYFWMQSLTNFQNQAASGSSQVTSYSDVTALPVLTVANVSVAPANPSNFVEDSDAYVSQQAVAGRGAQLRIVKATGAQYYQGPYTQQFSTLSEDHYVSLARNFVASSGWTEADADEPQGTRAMLLRATADGKPDSQLQKNVRVSFRRSINWNGQRIPVIGTGGEIAVQLNNDGSVLNASKVWRTVTLGATAPLKPLSQAQSEARQQLDNPNGYTLKSWSWGYKEESGNVAQKEMRVAIIFHFVPVMSSAPATLTLGATTTTASAPRTIEIAAQ